MRRLLLCVLIAAAAVTRTADGTLIDFDDRPGYPGPLFQGDVIPPEFVIDDEYLDRGVLFDSAGGGIFIAAPSNPVSPPNTVGGLGIGSVIDYFTPITIS